MKKRCDNGILKLRESEGITAATSSCPSGSIVKCLGKGSHVSADPFALEDFNTEDLKTLVEPLTCTFQLSKCDVPRDSSTYPTPIDKTLDKTIPPQNLNWKISVILNDSMSTLKRDHQKYLLSSGFFYFTTLSPLFKKYLKRRNECGVNEFEDGFETNDYIDSKI